MIFIAVTGKIKPGSIQRNRETTTAKFLVHTGSELKLVQTCGIEQYRLLDNLLDSGQVLILGTEKPNGKRPILVSRVILPVDQISQVEKQMIVSLVGQVFEAHL